MYPILLLTLLLSLAPGTGLHAQGCGPLPLGSPCAIGGLATAGALQPQANLAAGNPIHLVSGNKYQRETDLPAHPYTPGIELVRHYNSQAVGTGPLGQGWSFSYDTQLVKAGGRWQIIQADGSSIIWQGPVQAPHDSAYGSLRPNATGWVWRWPNGRELWFNPQGRLVRLVLNRGNHIKITRHADGSLRRVQHSNGARLQFHYLRAPMWATGADQRPAAGQAGSRNYVAMYVQTPRGRFTYGVQENNGVRRLRYVQRPDGMRRLYHHEAGNQAGRPGALTGISLVSANAQRQVRLSTWQYDRAGRAVAWYAGHSTNPNIPWVRLGFDEPSATTGTTVRTVQSSHGTRLRIHSQPRHGRDGIHRIEQLGCTGCPGPGWPGLTLAYNAKGQLHEWASTLTGVQYWHYNDAGRVRSRTLADGSQTHIRYNSAGQPTELRNVRHGQHETTRMNWVGAQLAGIEHPNETEQLHYDAAGRVNERMVRRVLPGSHAPTMIWRDRLDYTAQGHLQRHHLPEGGQLLYVWGPGRQRLLSLTWVDPNGTPHTVIDTPNGKPGYLYGNGLYLRTRLNAQGRASQLQLAQPGQPALWAAQLGYDSHGRIATEHHQYGRLTGGPGVGQANAFIQSSSWAYAYDAFGRLAGARNRTLPGGPASQAFPPEATRWYAWNPDGSLAAQQHNGQTRRPAIKRNAAGLPVQADGISLQYGAGQRLTRATQAGQWQLRYTHNARGQRIRRDDGQTATDYLYLNNQLVTERTATGQGAPAVTRRYLYAGLTPVGLIDYTTIASGELFAIHADFTGAPRLITDAAQHVRWQADYNPGGLARKTGGDMNLLLRLPGQMADPALGWHDNLLRTYMPQWGQYLEPDPAGPLPGQQALGYAAQQPRRHADPSGLMLFAFDGTRNDESVGSNVWKLSQAYRDGPVYYHRGPGNSLYLDWNALTAADAGRILDTQWQHLLNAIEQHNNQAQALTIDIVGFSRGAALARDFGNRINRQSPGGYFSLDDPLRGVLDACVDLRFMGLFDTVAQFGIAGANNSSYDLSIAPVWTWVAHAVALQERRWLFPLSSAADLQSNNVIEAPFIGAHADIGGGQLPANDTDSPPAPAGDLGDITLAWMAWQAKAAGVMFELQADDRSSQSPLLHDERSALARRLQNGDRGVLGSHGNTLNTYQNDHPYLGQAPRSATEALIVREPDWLTQAGNVVGTVDMSGYARWLHDTLGWQDLPA
jgi:RHS repeat-associated protein